MLKTELYGKLEFGKGISIISVVGDISCIVLLTSVLIIPCTESGYF